MFPARRLPTLADIDALPPGIKGEIIDDVLYTMTRPRARHQGAVTGLGADVQIPFQRQRGGPGGWWILVEPGIELPTAREFSPDAAGWRRERLPMLPDEGPLTVVPDWICEVLSTHTRDYDLTVKKPFYARIGVRFLWLLDLDARVLTAHRLEGPNWLEVGAYADDAAARIPPFDAVPLDVTEWYPPGDRDAGEMRGGAGQESARGGRGLTLGLARPMTWVAQLNRHPDGTKHVGSEQSGWSGAGELAEGWAWDRAGSLWSNPLACRRACSCRRERVHVARPHDAHSLHRYAPRRRRGEDSLLRVPVAQQQARGWPVEPGGFGEDPRLKQSQDAE